MCDGRDVAEVEVRASAARGAANCYLKIRLLLPPGDEPTSREMFTRTVNEGLLQLYGLVGGAIVLDLVEYQPTASIGILKLADKREVDKVRSAATLLTATSDGRACKLETLGTARELQSLR